MEVRRFLCFRNTVLNSACAPTEPAQGSQRSRSAAKREPWKDKKYGYTPGAKHDRVKFMNDEVLPTFIASQWKFAKNQKDFVKKFHCEGRRQYEIRKNVLQVSQRLENVCNEKNPASAGKFFDRNYKLKPKDATVLRNNVKTVDEIQLSANKVRQGIAKQDALLFSTTTRKLKTGNECAHQLHEKCFGSLDENDAKVREIKEKLEELLKKHKQLYKFTSRANLKTSSRRVKEGRTKARTRKIKRREANVDKIMANISSSYKSSGVIDELDLSKVQALTLREVKWIKYMLESEKLTENIRRTFLENLKPAVKRAVAEATVNERDASSSEDEESNEKDSSEEDSSEEDSNEEDSKKEESAAKRERAGEESSSDQESGEGSIDEVQEQEELMTVEQAELMEQYRNDFFWQF